MNHADISRRFEYHPPSTDEVRLTHESVRDRCMALAFYLERILPDCDERDQAIRSLDLTAMWANSCVARTQLVRTPPPAKSEEIA